MRTGLAVFAVLLASAAVARPPVPPRDSYNETPARFVDPDILDYTKTTYDIPMRDGVKLHTVVLRPKALTGRQPIILERTPYNAESFASQRSPHLAAALGGRYDSILKSGYILVFQDVRGKYGSQGTYVMNRPIVGGGVNPTRTDDATDAYDSIDWLVKHVPDNNGRVGTIGVSYDGFTVLMSLVNPHPALKAAVPINPMVDGWMGDDWFHHGAFRQFGLDYVYDQEATRKNEKLFVYPGYDEYTTYLRRGSAGAYGEAVGLPQTGFWRQLTSHPDYDSYWQSQAMDKILGARPLTVPTLIVHSLFDQEDIYGAPAVWNALKDKYAQNGMVRLAFGPWFHGGGSRGTGAIPGPIRWGSDTSPTFRQEELQPFLDAHLKTDGAAAQLPTVYGYETGSNQWKHYATWPQSCASGCPYQSRPLYLSPGGALGFVRAGSGEPFAEYISDPAKPIPYVPRPVRPSYQDVDAWRGWLLTDQRNAAARPDVLTFETGPLTEPLRIAGTPIAHLIASTSGTDSDFVVKLIDVYPEDYAPQPELGGYQMMVSADIIRGRYRDDPSKPEPFVPNQPTPVTLPLPNANHVFQPGHRIMVQVQSSWFPLYDRNPQSFVKNIFFAKPGDYRKAVQRVYLTGQNASWIDLPVAPLD